MGNPRQLRQVHASSAFERLGGTSEGKDQWGAVANLIHEVADEVSDPEIREGFLYAAPIRAILSKAAES